MIAEEVDHIDPVDGPNDPKFWDPTNWQSLCKTCHSKKTVLEDGGFGRQKHTVKSGQSIEFLFEVAQAEIDHGKTGPETDASAD